MPRTWSTPARLGLYLFGVFVLLGSLVACGQKASWKLLDISGVMPDLKFSLTDTAGHKVDANTYRGKIVMMYFGYTHCPDICPITMAKVAQALRKLDHNADQVRVLFVSVDPQRDTPQLLSKYMDAFGPEFVGLRGDETALRKLTKRYRVTFSHGKPDANGDYEVTHSSAVFIFDGTGRIRLMERGDDPAPAITHDIQQLINEM